MSPVDYWILKKHRMCEIDMQNTTKSLSSTSALQLAHDLHFMKMYLKCFHHFLSYFAKSQRNANYQPWQRQLTTTEWESHI